MSTRKPTIIQHNEAFICGHCGAGVDPLESGGQHRNHCPSCLWSRHLDMRTGDRRSGCKGLMEPIAVWVRSDGEWAVVHRCQNCGRIVTNRIAADDSEGALLAMAFKPITALPFPAKTAFEVIAKARVQ